MVFLLGGHRFLLRSLSNECDRRCGSHALGRGGLCGRRRQRPLSRRVSTTGTLLLLGLRPAGSRARGHGTRVGKELLADPWRIAEITSGPRRCSGRRRDKCWPAQAWHHGAPAGEVAGAGLKVRWRRGRSRGIASEQGLKSGDVILELGDLKVVTPEEVRKAMGEAQKEIASMPRGGYAAHADEIRQYDQVRCHSSCWRLTEARTPLCKVRARGRPALPTCDQWTWAEWRRTIAQFAFKKSRLRTNACRANHRTIRAENGRLEKAQETCNINRVPEVWKYSPHTNL